MNEQIDPSTLHFTQKHHNPTSPFHISDLEAIELRKLGQELIPSPLIINSTSFNGFVSQLMIPNTVIELARKCAGITLSAREIKGIERSLNEGRLKDILDDKFEEDSSHPPYIRIDCTNGGQHFYGSPVVLEIWPGQHFSPIHSHGKTTGIIYCLTGKLDVMLYDRLDWDANKLGLLTLHKGDCAWLNGRHFPVHKVYSPLPKGSFAASLHAYINKDELPLLQSESDSRDEFDFVHEAKPHQLDIFKTYSDLTWKQLSREIDRRAPKEEFPDGI